MTEEQLERLPKHRKEWLEVFGNQWATSVNRPEPMTPEEQAALDAALNPFKESVCR